MNFCLTWSTRRAIAVIVAIFIFDKKKIPSEKIAHLGFQLPFAFFFSFAISYSSYRSQDLQAVNFEVHQQFYLMESGVQFINCSSSIRN